MTRARQALAPAGTAARLSAAAGRKGFKAELGELRERMPGLDLGHGQIAGEIARRYRLRLREAYPLAHAWTPGRVAVRFNARAAELGTDPSGLASLTGNRLCEYEKWPQRERMPSVYVLVMLAHLYQTGVLDLLDLADHERSGVAVFDTAAHSSVCGDRREVDCHAHAGVSGAGSGG